MFRRNILKKQIQFSEWTNNKKLNIVMFGNGIIIGTKPVEKVKSGYERNSIKTLERVCKHYYFIIRARSSKQWLMEFL